MTVAFTGKSNLRSVSPSKGSISPFSRSRDSGFRRKAKKQMTMTAIKENKANITYDEDGDEKINQYRTLYELGAGAFGQVMLVIDDNTDKKYVRDC